MITCHDEYVYSIFSIDIFIYPTLFYFSYECLPVFSTVTFIPLIKMSYCIYITKTLILNPFLSNMRLEVLIF